MQKHVFYKYSMYSVKWGCILFMFSYHQFIWLGDEQAIGHCVWQSQLWLLTYLYHQVWGPFHERFFYRNSNSMEIWFMGKATFSKIMYSVVKNVNRCPCQCKPISVEITYLWFWRGFLHEHLARFVNLRFAYAPGMPRTFFRHRPQKKPLVSDPGVNHCTCFTHVSWCMSGSLNRRGGESVPGIPGACTTSNFTYLARGPMTTAVYICASVFYTYIKVYDVFAENENKKVIFRVLTNSKVDFVVQSENCKSIVMFYALCFFI